MKTFKELDIKVSSSITPLDESGLRREDGESEKASVSTRAFMCVEDGKITLSYLEENEGARVNTDIEIEGEELRVRRRGALESEFVFREGKTHRSLYKVPPYTFDAEITTKRIRNEISADGGTLTVFYNMLLGGESRAVKMRIEVYDT